MAEFPVTHNGHIYDLKKFLSDHPGGVNTLKNFRGKNISKAMAKFGHSISAYNMLRDFKLQKDHNVTGLVSESGRIIKNDEAVKSQDEIDFLEELESRLDWSKPIVCQLEAIAPDYKLWVNSPVYRRCKLFANPLESMTFTPWYLVPLVWIPIVLYFGCTEFLEHVLCNNCEDPISPLQFTYHLTLGVLIWSCLEYSLHRWVFHLDPGSNITMIKMHFLLHGLHHKMPFDVTRQVFPPIPAMFCTYIIYIPVRLLLSYPKIKLTGGLIGYLTYDMIHYYVHQGAPQDGTYLYEMKRYHSNHHFLNHDKAFGISSKFWDHIFNTFVTLRRLNFSLKW